MKTAKEAGELASSKEIPAEVSRQCDKALDKAIEETIRKGRRKVDIALGYKDCPDDDDTIQAYLYQLGYKDVQVSHDYPGYNETYEGRTFIKFSF